MKRFLSTYLFCGLLLLTLSGIAHAPHAEAAAGINYVPLAPINMSGSEFTSTSGCVAPTCFPKYLRTIFNVGIAMAGLFAVFSIIRGGFTLLFTDSILGHSEGKGMILRAVGGLLLTYASFILMNQISPALGKDLDLSLNFERVTIPEDISRLSVLDLEREFAEHRADIRDVNRAKEELATRQAAYDTALENAKAITDPTARAAAINALKPLETELSVEGRRVQAREATDTAKNRILGDFNPMIGLNSFSGIYQSNLPKYRELQLANEIKRAETVLNDNGELASYINTQRTKIDTLIAAATPQEKAELQRIRDGLSTQYTAKKNQLISKIKAECARNRGNLTYGYPAACDNYK